MDRERPIGDEFRYTEFHPGLPETIVFLRVESAEEGNCDRCYLKGRCLESEWMRIRETCGKCSKTFRRDKTAVNFVKIGHR